MNPAEDKSRLQIGPNDHKDFQNFDRLCRKTEKTWLKKYALGYRQLRLEERLAITNFLFLWRLFEAKVLKRRADSRFIVNTTERWARNGLLTKKSFESQIEYFRRRYYVDGKFTYDFEQLHLLRSGPPELVKEVLRNEDANAERVATAILTIIFRIRNNLFHGEKWFYELRGQLDNFNHANAALMTAIDLHEEAFKKRLR